jgi:hypothetical protein
MKGPLPAENRCGQAPVRLRSAAKRMTNDVGQMTNQARSPNNQTPASGKLRAAATWTHTALAGPATWRREPPARPQQHRREPLRALCFALLSSFVIWHSSFSSSATELSNYDSSLFSGAGNCAFCHDQWRNGLTDKRGRDVSIGTDWRATMMAHSSKDPLWRAVMEAEVLENPSLRSFIEDKCQTCHAPLAHTQAHADGTNKLAFADSRTWALAREGVACTLCHQIQATNLGTHASFTGHYTIGTNRVIYGPYDDVLTMPMQRHVDYTPEHGAHTQDSALCATCHTLFTPALAADGRIIGEYPEQVPYLEWRNSDFARQGRHCQDCHLPRLNEPIKVSSRPPWLEPRKPFWRHQFAGGNAFMLSLMATNAAAIHPNAEADQFQAMIEKSREQLQRAARLRVQGDRKRDELLLRVEVENLAGHKFPTGHPYRRAWLHVRVTDREGQVVFESGAVDAEGRIIGPSGGYEPHHDVITNRSQVQIYQAVMGDAAGQPTWSLLRGTKNLKDNRLPPRGMKAAGADAAHIASQGVDGDANFHRRANGRDEVTYRIALAGTRGALEAEVELLYQSVPPESVARLLSSTAPDAREFARLYTAMDQRPEQVQASRNKF